MPPKALKLIYMSCLVGGVGGFLAATAIVVVGPLL